MSPFLEKFFELCLKLSEAPSLPENSPGILVSLLSKDGLRNGVKLCWRNHRPLLESGAPYMFGIHESRWGWHVGVKVTVGL